MSEPSAPYVQAKAHEIKSIIPMLKGCFAQVYLTVGVYEVDPLGLTLQEITDLTGLSKPSVSAALKFLFRNNIIEGREEEGAIRYRACFGFTYGGNTQVDLRSTDEKNIFAPIINNPLLKENDNNSLKEEEIIIIERRKIFQSGGILGKPSFELSEKPIDLENARAWADWLKEQKATPKFNPQGFAVNALRNDPNAEPPTIKRAPARKREPHSQGDFIERFKAERDGRS